MCDVTRGGAAAHLPPQEGQVLTPYDLQILGGLVILGKKQFNPLVL